jgi:hypothetical protein
MQQSKTRNIYGLILLSAALLQFVLLVISMITSFFLPAESGMQPQWSSYLIALVLLGISAVGAYQLRTQRETTPFSQRVDVPLGLSLGIASAILLFLPGLGIALAWAAFGLPWLIGIPPLASFSGISPLFALLSTALYAVFSTIYALCSLQVTRRSGSVKQGFWSSILAAMATLLGASLTFSCIDVAAYFIFHTGSGLVAPSSLPGFGPLVNYIASYQGSVEFIAFWLLTPVIVGLLIALVSSFISRQRASRPALVQTN